MSVIGVIYLIVIIAAFLSFAITLAWVDWYTNRDATSDRTKLKAYRRDSVL